MFYFRWLSGYSSVLAAGKARFFWSSYFIFYIPSSAITNSYSCAWVDNEWLSSWFEIAGFLASGGLGI